MFRGLKWNGRTYYLELVKEFCRDKFGNGREWINRAHPLGVDGKAIIAHLPDDTDIEYIMARTKDLKDTGFAVHRDYTWDVRGKRAHLTAIRTEIERVCGRRKMPIIHNHLVVENIRFTWEGKRLLVGRQDGVHRLRQILDRDFMDSMTNLACNPPMRARTYDGEMTYAKATATPSGQMGTIPWGP